MQINRLFEIIYLLLERGSITAAELAEKFEVSTRTIYRDLDTLSSANIPVYTSKGKGGGIRLLPGYVLNKSLLTDSEQREILFGLQSMSAVKAADTQHTLERLHGLFKREETKWIDVDFSRWNGGESDKTKFELLKSAILQQTVITFTYYGSNGTKTERRIEPCMLRFKNSDWYLQGFCLTKKDTRVFKISRMESVELTAEHFERRESAEKPLHMPTPLPARMLPLQLRFSPKAAFRVYDEFRAADITRDSDGNLCVRIDFPDDMWLYTYLLSYGDDVTVLSPLAVARELRDRARKIFENYKEMI